MSVEWQKSQVSVASWLLLRDKVKRQQEIVTEGSDYMLPKSTWEKATDNIRSIAIRA